jgi:ATP-dependent helicase Lhr and Lhr-like helicase
MAGRWNLLGGPNPPIDAGAEAWVEILLRRYGILFKTLVDTETLMPPWSSLLPILRRKEIRGEIRGGRFIAGVFGEQFALPEALQALNRLEPEDSDPTLLVLNACDPLCLAGVVTPGTRIPRSSGNRVLYRGGVPVGYRIGKIITLTHPDLPEAWQLKNVLLRDLSPVQLKAYLT